MWKSKSEQKTITKAGLHEITTKLVEDLEYELSYAKQILAELKDSDVPIEDLDITSELDYLIRDLKPEYEKQSRAFDTYSDQLKEVLEYIQSKNKQ